MADQLIFKLNVFPSPHLPHPLARHHGPMDMFQLAGHDIRASRLSHRAAMLHTQHPALDTKAPLGLPHLYEQLLGIGVLYRLRAQLSQPHRDAHHTAHHSIHRHTLLHPIKQNKR